MAVLCNKCGKEYDVTLFEFGRTIQCDCGAVVERKCEISLRAFEEFEENSHVHELKRACDRICSLILMSDYPIVDIKLEIAKLREKVRDLFPDKKGLFEMVYVSRFKRLCQQFRSQEMDK